MAEQVRYALIAWETMQALRESPQPLTSSQVMEAVGDRISPTAHEGERVKSGGIRWQTILHFKSGDAVTLGWMTKRGGWSLVEAGIAALEEFPPRKSFMRSCRGSCTRLTSDASRPCRR
jgi:hypothetical protein